MKTKLFVAITLIIIGLIYFILSSANELNNLYQEVEVVDNKVKSFEDNLISAIKVIAPSDTVLAQKIEQYKFQANILERHKLFDQILTSVLELVSSPKSPAQKAAADEISNAMVKRTNAMQEFSKSIDIYNQFTLSLRGRVARRCTNFPSPWHG